MKRNLFVLTLMIMGNIMFSMDNSELSTALSNLEINEHNDALDKEGLRFVLGLDAENSKAVSFNDAIPMGKPAQEIIKEHLLQDLKQDLKKVVRSKVLEHLEPKVTKSFDLDLSDGVTISVGDSIGCGVNRAEVGRVIYNEIPAPLS